MADMLRAGMEYLESQRTQHMTQSVTYYHGASSLALLATIGKTQYQIQDDGGSQVGAEIIDFIVLAEDLKIASVKATPKLGDKIETDRAIYEVLFLSGDGCWRYSDPYGIAIRIHTKQVS